MSTLLRRLSVVAFLGVVAGAALADGTKPTKPGAAKPGKPAATKAAASLDEITTTFDEKEKQAHNDLRRERWTAIEAYVKANGSAKDVEVARKTLVDVAEELEDWGKTVASADAYLGAHGDSKEHVGVRLSRAGALAKLGKDGDAKTAYEGVTKSLDVAKDGAETCFAAWGQYADHLISMGDIEGAKAAYEAGKDACHHPQVTQFFDGNIANLAKIGTDPDAFPDTAKDLDGKAVALADFKDKVLLIDFWATWCPPCRAEIPHIVAAYDKYHDKGFEIVGVTLDRPGDAEKVKEFAASHKMPWRQVYYPDGQNEVANLYGVEGIPHTVLVGRDGKIVRVGLRGAGLERVLEKVLAAKAAK